MSKANTPNVKVSPPASTMVQSSHEAQVPLSVSPGLEAIKRAHEAFKCDANVVLKDIFAGFQKFIAEEAKKEVPKLFENNHLGEYFQVVSSRLKSFLALQKGAVEWTFHIEKTPYYQSLKNISQGMGRVSKSVGKLHAALQKIESGIDTTSTPAKLRATLRALKESVKAMLDHIDYTAARNDPEREKLLFSACVLGDSLLEGIEEVEQNLAQAPNTATSVRCLREFGKSEIYQKVLDKMNSPERLDFKAWAMEELASIKKSTVQLKADVTTQVAETKEIDSTKAHSIKQEKVIEVLQERCDEIADKLDNVSFKSLEHQAYTDNKITAEIEEISLAITHTAFKIDKL